MVNTTCGGDLGDVTLRPATIVGSEIRQAVRLVDLTRQLVTANKGATLKTEREVRADR